MALVHEDGTGVTNAESLVSVAEADAYWVKRGSPSSWTDLSTADKESALRYGTEWVMGTWRNLWLGTIANDDQALDWPRDNVVDNEGRVIAATARPEGVMAAVIRMALNHVTSSLSEPKDGGIDALKVGPIELEFSSSVGASTTYPEVYDLVAPYVLSGPGEIRLLRA